MDESQKRPPTAYASADAVEGIGLRWLKMELMQRVMWDQCCQISMWLIVWMTTPFGLIRY